MRNKVERDEFYLQDYAEEEKEIDLFEIFGKLWNNKKIILIIVILGSILSLVGAKIYKRSASVSRVGIAFNFEEIKEGKNPDGTNFNSEDILPNSILKSVYEEYKKISNDDANMTDFRNYIKINPVIPKNISVLVEKNLKDGIFYSFTPSEYFINFRAKLDNETEKQLLDKLVKEALAEYVLKYRPFSELSQIDIKKLNNESLTYEDYLTVINTSIDSIKNDIKMNETKKLKFVTPSLNYNFSDILLNLNLIKSIQLNRIEAMLDLSYVSSNIEKSNATLSQKLQELNIDKQVLIRRAQVLRETIDNYKVSTKELILPDGMNAALPEKDDYYAKLINDYVETSTKIEANAQEAIKIEKKLRELSKATNDTNEIMVEEFKNVINLVNEEIIKLNVLNKKYYESEYSEMVRQISPAENVYTGKPIIIFIAVGAFLSFALACTYILVKEAIKAKKENEEK